MKDEQEIFKHFIRYGENGEKIQNTLEFVKIDEIKILKKNPRKHSEKQIQKLINSIKKNGFLQVILINHKKELITGEARLIALKKLGYDEVPVFIVENISDETIRAYRIIDNRISEDAEWDYNLLKEEIDNLIKFDFTLESLGFESIDYDKIYFKESYSKKHKENYTEDNNWIEKNIPKRVKLGDLYRMGDHFLFCGDSLNAKSFSILMQGEKAKIVVTDPPYNCSINKTVCGLGKIQHKEFQMASGEMSDKEFADFISNFMKNLVEYSTSGSLHYMFIDWRGINILLTQALMIYSELINILCWDKGTGGMGSFYRSQHELIPILKNGTDKHQNHIQLGKYGRYRTNILSYPGIRVTNPASLELLKLHPTVKSVPLIHDILLDASSENDIVLDCFGGSGSTLIAAERCKRRARLIELEPRYCDVIIYRYEEETGKKATFVKNIGDIINE